MLLFSSKKWFRYLYLFSITFAYSDYATVQGTSEIVSDSPVVYNRESAKQKRFGHKLNNPVGLWPLCTTFA